MTPDTHDATGAVSYGVDESALEQLLSADQGQLLDIIDTLRNTLREYRVKGDLEIPLPQIVVCGDQSSGKSSVLEAISGLAFPKDDTVCTTFATQLALRRSATPSVAVSIVPAPTRCHDEMTELLQFKPKSESIDDFEATVREAKEFLRANRDKSKTGEDSYFQDFLRIEVRKPNLQPLTLVDLPGIIHSINKRQVPEDKQLVRDLVMSYLEDRDTIIMTIISASNDLENQEILEMVKKADPERARTLGVITKPDTLTQDRKREVFIKCAQNDEHSFGLGWHVVKNQDLGSRASNLEEREREENEFFERSTWMRDLREEQLGITALRYRLRSLLEERTRPALEKVVPNIKLALDACKLDLDRLGGEREEPFEQRNYMLSVSQLFSKLLKQALEGTYNDTSFFLLDDESHLDPRALRAAVANLTDGFAAAMRVRGHQTEVVDGACLNEEAPINSPDKLAAEQYEVTGTDQMEREDFIAQVDNLSRVARSKELPGLPNQRIIPELIRRQIRPWETIATQYIEKVRELAQSSLRAMARHVTSVETSLALDRLLVSPELDRRESEAKKTLKALLKPFERDYIICLDSKFLKAVSRLSRDRQVDTPIIRNWGDADLGVRRASAAPLARYFQDNVGSKDSEASKDGGSTSAFMLDYMLAYYKVAMRGFIDNVANLAVENCLIDGLADCLAPEKIFLMDQELLAKLAAESDAEKRKRTALLGRQTKLQNALDLCREGSRLAAPSFTSPRPSHSRNSCPTVSAVDHTAPSAPRNETGVERGSSPSARKTQPSKTGRRRITVLLPNSKRAESTAASGNALPSASHHSTKNGATPMTNWNHGTDSVTPEAAPSASEGTTDTQAKPANTAFLSTSWPSTTVSGFGTSAISNFPTDTSSIPPTTASGSSNASHATANRSSAFGSSFFGSGGVTTGSSSSIFDTSKKPSFGGVSTNGSSSSSFDTSNRPPFGGVTANGSSFGVSQSSTFGGSATSGSSSSRLNTDGESSGVPPKTSSGDASTSKTVPLAKDANSAVSLETWDCFSDYPSNEISEQCFQSISAAKGWRDWSFEELRLPLYKHLVLPQ